VSQPIPAFDPNAPLSFGTTLLEASAGTGKTHNITNLVMRLVSERDVRIDRLLVVTFTRAATAELRERVRRRLGQGIAALTTAATDPDDLPDQEEDHVLHDFVARAQKEDAVARWRQRLLLAHETFDEAAISTIHGFCQKTLQQSAFESDLDFEAELREDLQPLLEEIVDDFFAIEIRRRSPDWYRYLRDVSGIGRKQLLSLAHVLERNPDVPILPEHDARPDPEDVWREDLAAFKVQWAAHAKAAAKILVAAYRAKEFHPRQKKYNTAQPAKQRAKIDQHFEQLESHFSEAKDAIRFFGLSQILGEALPNAEIDPSPLFEVTQTLIDRSAEALLVRFVDYVREELPKRKIEQNVLSFDDLLRRLSSSLTESGEDVANLLRRRIRDEFDAALIDEFQDTDPVQWDIFRTVFGSDAYLYLVGDPKQAIYAFRGADVYTYLRAKKAAAGRQYTLAVNWRSDQRYVDALNAALDVPGLFGEEGIEYVHVAASPGHGEDRLTVDGQGRPPLQLRFFSRDLYRGSGVIPRSWRSLPGYVAADVVRFLDESPDIYDEKAKAWRKVEPRDIAVLVRRNIEARQIQAALLDASVPAVITGAGSVYQSGEAEAIQRLLDALIHPSSEGKAKAAWTSVIFDVSANELAEMEDVEWEAKLERLHEWSATWQQSGFWPTLRRIFSEEEVPRRVLARSDGERSMTNLLHLAELLHAAETKERLGPSALNAWLRDKRLDPDEWHEEAELRLESDADAVTIVTVHRSKGLEYPIVFCPTLWDGQLLKTGLGEDKHLRFHDDDEERTLRLDLRLSSRHGPKLANVELAKRERQAEQMRLLYVALTRAKHRAIVYWGAFRDHETSALARVLHPQNGTESTGSLWLLEDLDDETMLADLRALADEHPDLIELSVAGDLERPVWMGASATIPDLQARVFERERIDRWWRRSSYSSLTRKAEDHRATEGSPEAEGQDHDELGEEPLAEAPAELWVPEDAADVPLAGFPRGRGPGTFLHKCLELFDFQSVGEPDTLESVVSEQMGLHGIRDEWLAPLCEGLTAALSTPLGGPLGAASLRQVPRGRRIDEMDFELPIAGGYESQEGRNYIRPHALAGVFQRNRPASSNLSAVYLDRLEHLGFGPPVRGFLTGSIDLVFSHDVEGHPRWFVADYKSNWMGSDDHARSTTHHYPSGALAEAMGHRHYYLQYHLYVLALHRYLRWRLPNYDYDRDFGGVYYLFLRGMVGPETPCEGETPNGVFFDRPPRALIEALDRLFTAPQLEDPDAGGAR
jgi:exodeoxyribonuclease V beta subunit